MGSHPLKEIKWVSTISLHIRCRWLADMLALSFYRRGWLIHNIVAIIEHHHFLLALEAQSNTTMPSPTQVSGLMGLGESTFTTR